MEEIIKEQFSWREIGPINVTTVIASGSRFRLDSDSAVSILEAE